MKKQIFIHSNLRPPVYKKIDNKEIYGTFSSKEGGSDGKEGGSDGKEGGGTFYEKAKLGKIIIDEIFI
jgi:hypothetical protein